MNNQTETALEIFHFAVRVRTERLTHLPIYLKDFGDEPSWGNLHFSTNLQSWLESSV
jgi:hypothetical protein